MHKVSYSDSEIFFFPPSSHSSFKRDAADYAFCLNALMVIFLSFLLSAFQLSVFNNSTS